jgi:small conductance mechanosensitive channel
MQEQMLGIALTYGPKALVAALMLAGGYFAAQWAGGVAGRSLERYAIEAPVRALLESAARVLVFGLFVIMALQNIGVQLLPLIAGLGVAGAAVALAMQGVLGNVAAGLNIIFSKPFRVGDYVAIAGVHGEVLDIRLSTTTLGHADLSRVVIPNRKIVGEILHNYGRIRQLAIEVTVPYESDIEQAIDTAQAVLRANPRVLRDPLAGVGVARLGDAGVTLSLTPWVAVSDYGAAGAELNQAILAAFRNRKILRGSTALAAAA